MTARNRSLLVATLLGAAAAPRAGHAQACDSVASRTSLSRFAGAPIGSVRVITQDPRALPGPASALNVLHVRTRESTVRRQLRFAAGDTVDTLAIAESIRRLRLQRYLGEIEVVGVRCGDADVDLTVVTRDEWSTKPRLQVRSSASSQIGVTERNVLGTGREASVQLRSQNGRIGLAVAMRDPWFLGSRWSAELSHASYRDGYDWFASLETRERSVLDPWHTGLTIMSTNLTPRAEHTDQFQRTTADLLITRRVRITPSAVTSLLGGGAYQRTTLLAAPDAPILGPSRVDRSFAGLSGGIARRAIAYDTLTWLLPRSAIVDVPLALESEAVLSAGRDMLGSRPAAHADLWAGRAWIPSRGSLLIGDIWGSAWLERRDVDAATVRASLAFYHRARGGVWSARLAGERLLNPDPDVRSFVTADPTDAALPDSRRLAEFALGASVERSWHLFSLSRSWTVDIAALAAASTRLDALAPSPEHSDVAIVGGGLRLAPAKLGRGTARLDLGWPVIHSAQEKARPFVAISLAPYWGELRHRDGRRQNQP